MSFARLTRGPIVCGVGTKSNSHAPANDSPKMKSFHKNKVKPGVVGEFDLPDQVRDLPDLVALIDFDHPTAGAYCVFRGSDWLKAGLLSCRVGGDAPANPDLHQ